MDMNIVTLPRKGLKKYDYNIDMTTLPKKGLKTRPYNIGMGKRYLTLRAPRVLVPTPSTKGGSKRTPPVSQEREMLQT